MDEDRDFPAWKGAARKTCTPSKTAPPTWRLRPWALATSSRIDEFPRSFAADSVRGEAGERKPRRLVQIPREAKDEIDDGAAEGREEEGIEGGRRGFCASGEELGEVEGEVDEGDASDDAVDRSMGWWN